MQDQPGQSQPMSSNVRAKLCQMIEDEGIGILDEPRRIRSALFDRCAEHKREVNVLVAALQEGIPQELRDAPGPTAEAHYSRLVHQLQDVRGLSPESAQWAVETWAAAIGRSIDADRLAPTDSDETRRAATKLDDETTRTTKVVGTGDASHDGASSDRAGSTSTAARRGAFIGTAAIVIAVLGILLVRRGDDSVETTAQSTATTTVQSTATTGSVNADAQGGGASTTGAPANRPPVAKDDYYPPQHIDTKYKDAPGPWKVDLAVFDNDYDDDDPPGASTVTFLSNTGATHGTVNGLTQCEWDPTRKCLRYSFSHQGPFKEEFRYTIRDANGATASATVTVDVP